MVRQVGNTAFPSRLDWGAFAVIRLAIGVGVGLALLLVLPSPADAFTQVTGDISTDTTWDIAGSPYVVVGNVRVLPGVTLTIRPGVLVKFDPGQSLVIDTGSLLAQGTPDSVIVFKRNQAGRWGVVAGYDADLTFRHCRLEWSSSVPIMYNTDHDGMISNAAGGNTIIEDCVLSNAGRDATEFQGGTVVFRRNLVQYTYRQGFNSWDHCNSIVEDCRVVSCFDDAYSITTVNADELVFRNNVAIDVGDDGLDIDHFGAQERITGFQVFHCNDKGISTSQLSVAVVVENSVVADANEGFTATDDSRLTLYNCVVYNCNRAFAAYERNPGFGGARLTIRNSIAWNSVTPVYLDSLSFADIRYSILDTPAPYPGGNKNADPRFANPDHFVFSLAPDSPAIDAGLSTFMPALDILGNPRVDVPWVPDTGGGAITYYDIGAYEFSSLAAPIADPAPSASRFQLRAAPTPASGPVAIAFDLPRAGQVEVQIYDAAGRAIERLHRGPLAAGHHELTWLGAGPAPRGVYFVRLRAGGEEAVEKIVRAR